jgi:hypothetical protein
MPLAIGYVLRGESDFAGENVLIAAAPPSPPARRAQGRAVVGEDGSARAARNISGH